jgi:regulator of sigma E protease
MSAVGSPSAAWLALPAAERNATFQAKSVGQRAAIVAAGPIANFLVAILAFMALFAIVGEPRLPPVIAGVAPQSAAAKAGLRTGDRVVAIDGDVINDFADIAMRVQVRADPPVAITVERAGRRMTLTATPTLDVRRDRFGREARHGMLGVVALPGAALRFTGTMLVNQAQGLWQIVTGERSVREMSGPIGTAQVSGEVASLGVLNFLFFMAFISINLGFINLLPVPTLDGGHLMFYAAEALQGRPVRKRAQEVAYRAGFVALVTFMVMVTVNDMRSTAIGARLFGLIG